MEEPDEWIAAALLHEAELSADLRARCYTAWALSAEVRGQFFVANERARAAIAGVSRPEEAGAAYSLLLGNTIWIDPDEAERLLEDPRWVRPLGTLADDYLLTVRATLANARLDHEGALALFAQVRPEMFFGPQEVQVAATVLLSGRPAEADEVLDRIPDVETWFNYALPFLRAVVAAARGRPETARAWLHESVGRVRRSKVPLGLADCVVGCAALAYHCGDARRAAELLAAVTAATGGGLRSPMSMCVFRHYRRAARAALGRDAVREARAAGEALSLEAAIARELLPDCRSIPQRERL